MVEESAYKIVRVNREEIVRLEGPGREHALGSSFRGLSKDPTQRPYRDVMLNMTHSTIKSIAAVPSRLLLRQVDRRYCALLNT
ncbi:hypothetical protein BHE74_00007101 [Ensete ventricosum]|nr:hypothetical protein BHE74_00007101 [Ensete ventricosum]